MIVHDATVAFPVNIFTCIDQPLRCESHLAKACQKSFELLTMMDQLGCLLATFHPRYYNEHDGYFQPANISYDELISRLSYFTLRAIVQASLVGLALITSLIRQVAASDSSCRLACLGFPMRPVLTPPWCVCSHTPGRLLFPHLKCVQEHVVGTFCILSADTPDLPVSELCLFVPCV